MRLILLILIVGLLGESRAAYAQKCPSGFEALQGKCVPVGKYLKNELKDIVNQGRVDEDVESIMTSLSELGENTSDFKKRWPKLKAQALKQSHDNCFPEVDLRKKMPPVRNQQDANLCFAYAAANVLSYKVGQDISPLDIAYSYQLVVGQDFKTPNGGDPLMAFIRALNGGLCLNSRFSDEGQGDKNSLAVRLAELEQKTWSRSMKLKNFAPTNLVVRRDEETRISYFCKEDSGVRRLFPTENLNHLLSGLSFALRDQAGQLIERACAPRIQVETNISAGARSMNNSETYAENFSKIDELLTRTEPLVISVDNFGIEKDRYHAMTLVGRKWNPELQRCDYIIRNSWGKNCSKNIPKEFRCIDSGEYAGDLVITREALPKYLTHITFLE